jgi:dTDP-4-dehydrorhamnose 3,5-epimerase
VIEGKIFDVALDIRKGSATYGKWFGIELDSESKSQLFIPRGFAHGFSVLSDIAVILYKVDNTYYRLADRGILLNDPDLNIDWKTGDAIPLISEKDKKNPPLKIADNNF